MSYENDDDVTNDLTPTFLNPADFPEGTSQTFRIERTEKRIYNENGKWVLIFHDDQCLGLNTGNLRLVANWFGRHPSGWIGKLVTVYRDYSVKYEGEVRGGWRLRQPGPDNKPVGLATELPVDDVPF
jgi:hypothetical protein